MDYPSNPYADYGTVVVGERFIGREQDIRVLTSRLLGPVGFGSLTLVGMPRIGKSSLVYKVLLEQKFALQKKRILVFQLSLGEYSSPDQLFHDLVSQSFAEMESANIVTDRLYETAVKAITSQEADRFTHIKRFFEIAKHESVRVVCIMEEFDSARYLFNGQRQCLHWLRELASNPTFKIGLVTISKRGLSQIASQSSGHDASYWHNVFMNHHLSLFSESDAGAYYQRLADNGVVLNPKSKQQVEYYCGHHPFYLDIFAFFLVESVIHEKQINIEKIVAAILVPFQEEFTNLTTMLNEDDRLKKLLQILFGPVIDVTRSDINFFVQYGLLKKNPDETYSTFSQYFQDFLLLVEREIDLWPLWAETERVMRRVITTTLVEKYGDTWPDKVERMHPNLKVILDQCKKQQRKEQERFGDRASDSLLDYAYPWDLFMIISSESESFGPILGQDKNYWRARFIHLSKVRTPLAHNRDLTLLEHERNTTEAYCKEIVHIFSQHSKHATR